VSNDTITIRLGNVTAEVPIAEWEYMREKKWKMIQCFLCFKLMWDRREVEFPVVDKNGEMEIIPSCIDCAIIEEEIQYDRT